MIVLSYGITKSGSTLAFEMAKHVLISCGKEQRKLPDGVVEAGHSVNFLNEVSRDSLKKLIENVADDEYIVIKTHARLGDGARDLINDCVARGLVKVHATCRDPREICLSLLDHGKRSRESGEKAFSEMLEIKDAFKELEKQSRNYWDWSRLDDALSLSYNILAFDAEKAITNIAMHLGIMKYDAGWVKDQVMNHAFTQKNKAVKDRYKSELSDEESREIEERFSDLVMASLK